MTDYKSDIHVKKNQASISKDTQICQELQEILQMLPCEQQISIQRKLNSKCSSWLTIVPTNELRDLHIELVKSEGFSQTVKEPIVSDADKNEGGLRADWGV